MCYCPLWRPECVCTFRARGWEFSALILRASSCARNIAEQLIEKGLASVVRHKRDDEDRSPDYDKLMAAEQA